MMQVTSPSGRAVFKLDFMAAGAQSYVDVLVCREPEPANLPLSDGTVTCYRNDTFIWWAPVHIIPLPFPKRLSRSAMVPAPPIVSCLVTACDSYP